MSKKQSKNNGIYQRNGTWYMDIRTPSGERVRRSLGTQDKQKAQELRSKLEHEFWQQSRLGIKPKKLWDEAALKWLEEKKHEKKSIDDDISRLRNLPQLRGIFLDELTRDIIMAAIEPKKCKPSTKNRYIALVRAILYKARDEWGWIDEVPKLKQYKETGGRIRWLKPHEAQRLIDALPDNFWRQMAIFSLCTGLRQGNVFGLKWEQVDLARRIAWIYADETKANKAIGVPLNKTAIQILSERLGKHPIFVFTNSVNNRIKELDDRVWERSLKKAQIKNFRWHDLRHTWASWLVQKGVPLLALKEMGGWEKLEMVMRYAHLATEHLQSHADILDKLNGFGHKMNIIPNKPQKENRLNGCLDGLNLAPRAGLEPATCGLTVRRSTD